MKWFKNLKKWQKGGLIGCGVGVLFACLSILSYIQAWYWWQKLHAFLFVFFLFPVPYSMRYLGFISFFVLSVVIIGCYGGFGALMGRVQQMANPFWKWLLTGLLILFLLFIYWFNFQVARWAEYL
jgi:hypothetical protein